MLSNRHQLLKYIHAWNVCMHIVCVSMMPNHVYIYVRVCDQENVVSIRFISFKKFSRFSCSLFCPIHRITPYNLKPVWMLWFCPMHFWSIKLFASEVYTCNLNCNMKWKSFFPYFSCCRSEFFRSHCYCNLFVLILHFGLQRSSFSFSFFSVTSNRNRFL